RLRHHVLHAKNLVVDVLAALPDQDIGAGDLAGLHLVLEERGDLRELFRIEFGAGRDVERTLAGEGALGGNWRYGEQREQRAEGRRTQTIPKMHQPLLHQEQESVAEGSVRARAAKAFQGLFMQRRAVAGEATEDDTVH